jgi:hypothetical protein
VKRLWALALLCAAQSAWAAPPVRVAVTPLRDVGLGVEAVAQLEQALVEAVLAQPGFSVANLSAAGRLTAPKGGALESPSARAQSLAKEAGANRALLVDVARLGEGQVVYLQRIDPKNGQSLGSTTASLSTASPLAAADRAALRGAVVRVLDPDRYLGRIALKLDVKGAQAQVDGRPLSGDLSHPIELSVGTHALRVTHPAYHDFLRFIDVGYDETVSLEVPLAAYPLSEGEMAERQRHNAAPVVVKRPPWYRTWWALSLSGVILTGLTAGIVFAVRPELTADHSLSYQFKPTP